MKGDFQKHTEETEKRIKDVEATFARLQQELKERNSECMKLEATLCGRIMELEGKLEQSVREKQKVEATLRGISGELEVKFDESSRMRIVYETQ